MATLLASHGLLIPQIQFWTEVELSPEDIACLDERPQLKRALLILVGRLQALNNSCVCQPRDFLRHAAARRRRISAAALKPSTGNPIEANCASSCSTTSYALPDKPPAVPKDGHKSAASSSFTNQNIRSSLHKRRIKALAHQLNRRRMAKAAPRPTLNLQASVIRNHFAASTPNSATLGRSSHDCIHILPQATVPRIAAEGADGFLGRQPAPMVCRQAAPSGAQSPPVAWRRRPAVNSSLQTSRAVFNKAVRYGTKVPR
jgi:hypothetical protein